MYIHPLCWLVFFFFAHFCCLRRTHFRSLSLYLSSFAFSMVRKLAFSLLLFCSLASSLGPSALLTHIHFSAANFSASFSCPSSSLWTRRYLFCPLWPVFAHLGPKGPCLLFSLYFVLTLSFLSPFVVWPAITLLWWYTLLCISTSPTLLPYTCHLFSLFFLSIIIFILSPLLFFLTSPSSSYRHLLHCPRHFCIFHNNCASNPLYSHFSTIYPLFLPSFTVFIKFGPFSVFLLFFIYFSPSFTHPVIVFTYFSLLKNSLPFEFNFSHFSPIWVQLLPFFSHLRCACELFSPIFSHFLPFRSFAITSIFFKLNRALPSLYTFYNPYSRVCLFWLQYRVPFRVLYIYPSFPLAFLLFIPIFFSFSLYF